MIHKILICYFLLAFATCLYLSFIIPENEIVARIAIIGIGICQLGYCKARIDIYRASR